MTTENTKSSHRKAIIFFDCYYCEINPLTPWNIERYCTEHNIEVINIIYKYENAGSIDFEILLYKLRNNVEPLIVIICKETYSLPENLISCAIFGTLTRLDLIKIYTYKATEKQQQEGKLTLIPYDDNNSSLIAISVAHLKQIQESLHKGGK